MRSLSVLGHGDPGDGTFAASSSFKFRSAPGTRVWAPTEVLPPGVPGRAELRYVHSPGPEVRNVTLTGATFHDDRGLRPDLDAKFGDRVSLAEIDGMGFDEVWVCCCTGTEPCPESVMDLGISPEEMLRVSGYVVPESDMLVTFREMEVSASAETAPESFATRFKGARGEVTEDPDGWITLTTESQFVPRWTRIARTFSA